MSDATQRDPYAWAWYVIVPAGVTLIVWLWGVPA